MRSCMDAFVGRSKRSQLSTYVEDSDDQPFHKLRNNTGRALQ